MPMPPSQGPREAFAAVGEPHPLDGGQGETWRVGAVVLKPAGLAAEVRWRASILDALPDTDRVRLGRPVRAASGDWRPHPAFGPVVKLVLARAELG